MKKLILSAVFTLGLFGQTAPEYTPSIGPPVTPITILYFRDGSSNQQYACQALSTQPAFTWSRSDSTLTSIVVSTNTATATTSTNHGLAVGNRVSVRGATVDTDLNGDYIVATVPSATTFTFTTANVANATYTDATMILYTTAPRSSAAIWSIWQKYYTSTNVDRWAWAEGSTAQNKICDSRASYAYN